MAAADVTTPDYLGMSDEDLLKAPAPDFTTVPATGSTDSGDDGDEVDPNATPADTTTTPGADGGASVEKSTEAGGGEATEPDAGAVEPDANAAAADKTTTPATEAKPAADAGAEVKPEAGKTQTPAAPAVTIDYTKAGMELLAPFKANGRTVEVKSVEDARALMQMGANYNKKMAALKPNLKLMKLLENNGLLNEDKLSFYIELEKKNPDAINKLVKDSGLNPMDLDAEKADSYKPTLHRVDDREIALDDVLDSIQDTPSYTRTLGIAKTWDEASKQVVAQNPKLLAVINDHVERGVFDLINAELERQRMLGTLTGVSDIEAYRQVGDAIEASGGFKHLHKQAEPTPTAPVIVAPKPKQGSDDKLNEKRRAAGLTKPAASTGATSDVNPLGLSDEEFEKAAVNRFK
jgi:hypothetical protein